MNFLDMKTVIFSQVLTNTVCAVVMLFLWYRNRKRFAGISYWAVGTVLAAAALLLIVLRGAVPDMISVVLGNALVPAGLLAIYMGLQRFVGKMGPQIHNYGLLAVFILAQAYYSLIQPNIAIRIINVSVVILILALQCMWLLAGRADLGIRKMTRGLGALFGVYGLISVARVITILFGQQPSGDFLKSGNVESLFLLSYQMLSIMLTFGLVLMVSRRLLAEVMTQEEKFSKTFHSSPYAVSLTRLSDGRIYEVNRGFVDLSGYAYDEVIGKTAIELNLWAREEDRMAAVDALKKRGNVQQAEFQFRKKSGDLMTGLLSADTLIIDNQAFVLTSISDITARKRTEEEREKLVRELQTALAKVKILSGMLPICSACKKIRDDKGYWTQIESYVRRHSDADFSHSICPDCARRLYPDMNPYELEKHNKEHA